MRPGMPPMGYYNRSFAGIRDIVVDPDRGDTIKEMFIKVAEDKYSGRKIIRWFKEIGFTTRVGRDPTLSQVYLMLKNPFYYREFEYPTKSGHWYKGKHPPLVTKEIFDRVQKQLIVPKKSKWGEKNFHYKNIFKCATCGMNILGEEKNRKLKNGGRRKHIYYHCAKQVFDICREPYISEEDLVRKIIKYIELIEKSNPKVIQISEKLKIKINNYRSIRDKVLIYQNINPDDIEITFTEYIRHILYNGNALDKREAIKSLNIQLYIHEREIITK